MISLCAKEPVAWVLPWRAEEKPAPPKILLRAGTVMERAAVEAELAGEHRAARVFRFEMEAEFANGAHALLKDSPDDIAQLLEWLATEAAGDPLQPEEAAMLEAARGVLAEHWPPYRALIARLERRNQITPIVAFRRFCVGWEGDGFPEFVKGPDGLVTLECMGELDSLAVQAAGTYAYSLLYAGGQEKNSGRPSKSGEGRLTSNSGTRRAGGKSGAKGGKKTRSSRSRVSRSRQ